MKDIQGSTFSIESRPMKRGFFFVAALLGMLAAGTSHGNERTGNLGVSITILPEAEVAGLPASVQRLAAVIPGYGNHWSYAKEVTRTDPVRAIHLMRTVHAQNAGEAHLVASEVIQADMIAAGQALFADFPDMGNLTAVAGSTF